MTATPVDEKTSFLKKYSYYIFLLTCVLMTFFVKAFVADAYYIPSGSMEPTIHGAARGGDRVLVNKLAYLNAKPKNGDVVVFMAADKWNESEKQYSLIKRVIATEGQTVAINDDGQITINGKPINEPYVTYNYPFSKGVLDCHSDPKSQRCFPAYTVPKDSVWLMGDNRANSMDSSYGCRSQVTDTSSCQGAVPVRNLEGHAIRIVYPFARSKSL